MFYKFVNAFVLFHLGIHWIYWNKNELFSKIKTLMHWFKEGFISKTNIFVLRYMDHNLNTFFPVLDNITCQCINENTPMTP